MINMVDEQCNKIRDRKKGRFRWVSKIEKCSKIIALIDNKCDT